MIKCDVSDKATRASWRVVVLSALTLALVSALPSGVVGQQAAPTLPSSPMRFGAFVARFGADGSFLLEGQGWPSFKGAWKADADRIELVTSGGPQGCEGPGRYRFRIDRTRV